MRLQVVVGQRADGSKGMDSRDEKNLRLEDITDAGRDTLVQERVRDRVAIVRPQSPDRLVLVKCRRQQILADGRSSL